MMQAWTPEGMAFLQDAMACCGYYPALARRIAPYLPKQAHVCDAGCGLGGLSVALLPLRKPGEQEAFGLLVLASPDPQRFEAGMGTDFLQRIADIASAALSRLL